MHYLKLIKSYKNEILFLSYQNVKTQYLETVFGIIWALVKPLTFVFTFWFFFTVGLRSGNPVNGNPFLLNMFAAYMPWFVMSELIISGTGVIKANKVLVRTIKFPVMALPLINTLSKMYVHIAVMLIVMLFYLLYGGIAYAPDIYYINFIYYWFTMTVFFTVFSMLVGSLAVVVKDVKPLVVSIMQPLMWFTPVLYTPATAKFELLMRLVNPLYYFIVGYKETLLSEKFFWENIWYDIYIWVVIVLLYFLALEMWKRVRPIMADLI